MRGGGGLSMKLRQHEIPGQAFIAGSQQQEGDPARFVSGNAYLNQGKQ